MSTAPERHSITTNEVRLVSVDFSGKLDSGELLTGDPTVTEVSTSDLTISNATRNLAEITVNGATVAISKGVQFKVLGAEANTQYTVKISCGTTSNPAQTVIGYVKFRGIA